MKAALLALLLPLAALPARADDAYASLVSMGEAADTDKGPDAGAIPDETASSDGKKAPERAGQARPEGARARIESGRAARDAARAERARRAEAALAAVAPKPAAFSAYWARVFARLHHPPVDRPLSEVVLSTAAPAAVLARAAR